MRLNKTFAVVMVLAFGVVGRAGASCSSASLKGNFGFVLSGLDSSFYFTVSGGLLTLNGAGGVTGTETTSDNGVITNSVAVTGRYAIKTNCSGTLTITPSGGSAQSYSVVIDSTDTRLEMIQTNAGYTVSGYALAQGTVTCTLEGVKGTYGYYGSGWQTSPTQYPTAIAGQVTTDGLGNLKGFQTGSAAGTILYLTVSGTYTVNSDCTGTTTTTTSLGITAHSNSILVNSGRTVFQIGTDAGTIGYSVGQKQ
jgi:hypothetical protein